jgi:nucleoside-diphosphate-sugar epimerase
MSTTIDKSKPVCVTGASGYIASWIVKYLLEDGFTVHATVRNPDNAKSVAHLKKAAEGATGTLTLFAADLLQPGSFKPAIEGCELVIHTASPFIIKGFKDAQTALVKPAVEGTENVLRSCNEVSTVKRVVLTSSVASIFGDNIEIEETPNGIFTEQDWNNTSSITHQPYSFSKVAAERKAWQIHDQQPKHAKQWDLVTINPSLVLGPALTRQTQSTSISVMQDLGSGKQLTGVPDLEFGLVDVREVARAHIQAGFIPKAEGRYIVSEGTYSLLTMAEILKKRFPKYPLPRTLLPKALVWLVGPIAAGVSRRFVKLNVGYSIGFDNARSRHTLQLHYRPIEETLQQHFQQMIDDGLLKKR